MGMVIVMKKLSILCTLILTILIGVIHITPQTSAIETESNIRVHVVSPDGLTAEAEFNGLYGSNISIDPSGLLKEGEVFAFYVYEGEMIKDQNHQFVVSPSTYIILATKQSDDIAVLFVDTNGFYLDHEYQKEPFEPVEPDIQALSKPGYSFESWNQNGLIEEDSVLTAVYQKVSTDIFTVEILGQSELGDGNYAYNEIATVSATNTSFSYWLHVINDNDKRIISYDETFTFTVLKDMVLEAVYDEEVNKTPIIYLHDKLALREGYDSYMSQVNLEDGFDLIEKGFIFSNTEVNKTLDDVDGINVIKYASKSQNNETNEYLVSVESDSFTNVRAYAVFADDQGNVQPVIYNTVVENTEEDPELQYEFDFTNATDMPNNVSLALRESFSTNLVNDTPYSFWREHSKIGERNSTLRGFILESPNNQQNISPYIYTGFKVTGLKKIEVSIGNWGLDATNNMDKIAQSIDVQVSNDGVNWTTVKDLKPEWIKANDTINTYEVSVPNESNEALYVRVIVVAIPDTAFSGNLRLIVTNMKLYA